MRTLTYQDYLNSIQDKDILEEYIIDSSTFKGVTKKCSFIHKECNEPFEMTPKNFRQGQRCPKCAAKKRIKINPLSDKELAKLKELSISVVQYNGQNKYSEFKCNNCEEVYNLTYKKMASIGCHCSLKETQTRETILKRIPSYQQCLNELGINVDIIPESFLGTVKKSKFFCRDCRKHFLGYYNNMDVKKQTCCPYCPKETENRFDYYNNLLKERGLDSEYKIITKEIFNSKDKVEFYHISCKSTFDKSPADFFSNEQHCKECSRNLKDDHIEYIKGKLFEHGFELLDLYTNTHTNVNLKCIKCGTLNKKTVNNVINNNNRCVCSSNNSIGEQLIAKYLTENGIEFKTQVKFKGLINKSPLKVDFYLPSLRTVIEFDGIQHFKPVELFGGEEYLKYIQCNDQKKNKFFKKKKVNLIRIPYTKIKQIDKILSESLGS